MNDTTIKVSFEYFGKDVNPDEITAHLKMSPTKVQRKGDAIDIKTILTKNATLDQRKKFYELQREKNTARNKLCYHVSRWGLKVYEEKSLDINSALEKMIEILGDKSEKIKKINKLYGIKPSIVVVLEIANDIKPIISLDRPIIKFAANIDANIDIDWYFV